MQRTDKSFQKLDRIRQLIDLQRSAEEVKKDLQDYVIERTEDLRNSSAQSEFSFDIDQELAKFLTAFDNKVHEIEQELVKLAA